jgi:hypothetical protein
MFRFDIETKRCILFKLSYERKQNKTKTFKIVLNYRYKRAKHAFFHERKQKTNRFRSQKNETLASQRKS